ncbi:MAG: Rieske (2Fe-2S) protein [FCB group bacterium]|nr:Rieske (2Fe-2S) protein [FCB group bacterium]
MASDEKTVDKGRRSFLGKMTLGLFTVGLFGQGWTYMRSLVPNVLYEPPQKFKIGLPEEMAEGVNFIESRRVFVIREGHQFTCISAKCTHLGCTVKYVPLAHQETIKSGGEEMTVSYEFQCPCHGSKFRQNGAAYSGPAPGALSWHKIEIAPEDGQLLVDVSSSVDNDFKLVV